MINDKDLKLKVGQTVYWTGLVGEVIKVSSFEHDLYLYLIEFKELNGDPIRNWFTKDGYINILFKEYQLPLSLTPYTVKLDGYSNTPPLPELDKDKAVYVRAGEWHEWKIRYPSHFNEDGKLMCFIEQNKEGRTVPWNQYSFTNPLDK